MDRQEFRVFVAVSWLYALGWAATLVAFWVYWSALALYVKVGVGIVLILLAPAGSDLVQSYEAYRKQREIQLGR